MLCDIVFPGKIQHTHLLPQDRVPMTDEKTDTNKAQLGKPMSFIEVIYRSMSEGLFTRAEMTQRQLHHKSPP